MIRSKKRRARAAKQEVPILERVARAIARSFFLSRYDFYTDDPRALEIRLNTGWMEFEGEAKAALDELMIPGKEMIESGSRSRITKSTGVIGRFGAERVWARMVKAARGDEA